VQNDQRHILIVEDDDLVREAIKDYLINAGFCITTAATGAAALTEIQKRTFHLIIADIRLPGDLDGVKTVQKVRVFHPDLKCLFMSGRMAPVILDQALDDFVTKPFNFGEFLGCVLKMLYGNHPNPRLT